MNVSARIVPLSDPAGLELVWRDLEERSERPFFLSWTWIGTWLACFARAPWLLEARDGAGRVVGLGLFCESREVRKKLVRARQLRLHETGVTEQDVVTVEYNGLLAERGCEDAVWSAALATLAGPGVPKWDEVVVSGTTDAAETRLARCGLTVRRRAEAGSAFVDLSGLRDDGIGDVEGYLGTLGKSSRSQIRRSMKLYRERGPLALDTAGSLEQAQQFLAELGPLHEAKWNAAGKPGATQRAEYMRFHRELMSRAYRGDGAPAVELLRARAGDEAFGFLYNFLDRGRVYFYLSGFAFETDNRLKPGLVTHALAIERHLKDGMATYDFMGGDNRYKTSMGQTGPQIVSIALQRRTVPMLLEAGLRRLRSRLGR